LPYRSSRNTVPHEPIQCAGEPIRYYRPKGSQEVRLLIDRGFQAFNASRLNEACHIFSEKMLAEENDTTIGLTMAGALTPAGLGGCVIELMERGLVDFVDDVQLYEQSIIRIYDVLFPSKVLLKTDEYIRDFMLREKIDQPISTSEYHYRLGLDLISQFHGCEKHSVLASAASTGVPIYTSSPGDSSIGMNVAYHALMNNSHLSFDSNRDVNEICALILAAKKNGCVILGGGSPKNFYLQGQPTLWEVYGIQKGGNDYYIQITTDQAVWGGLSGATPSEAVSWGKVNPGVLPETVVAYCDSTIAFPLLCEYVLASERSSRPRRELWHRRDVLVEELHRQAKAVRESQSHEDTEC